MPRAKKEPIQKALSPIDTPERFRLSEIGNAGIRIFNGVSSDELKRELNFPYSVRTFKEMSYHSSINSAITLYTNILSKLNWSFKPRVDATDAEKEQCKIIESMMQDMDQSWTDFIQDACSTITYGFAVHEKVFRKRTKSAGSMYDDGLIGWKKLPLRAQESIDRFVFSDDGNELIGVRQNLNNVQDNYGRFTARNASAVVIPRSKFLHFRTGNHRGDPMGKSPLRDAYLAWRYLVALEEIEATGVAKDLSGIPVLHIPMEYLSANASDSMKEIRAYWENSVRNLQAGSQTGMVLPLAYDPESKQPMFKLELMSLDGKRGFDIDVIKQSYRNLIYTSLMSDILSMGQTSTGSFALGAIKNSLSGTFAERIARNIVDVLNSDLAKITYELNGWDVSRMGTFDFDGLDGADMETLGKFLQRTTSVALVEKDRSMLNLVRKTVGVDPLPDDIEPRDEYLSDSTSRAGDGMATPFEGTRTSDGGKNDADNNMDNVA